MPDPVRGPLVTNLFEWYAAGTHPLDAVTAAARAAGLRSARGTPVLRASVHQMLRNRMDTGRFVWKGKLQQGRYEPLVSEELWLKVQGVLAARAMKKPRFVRHDFAFARLVNCGHCGCALVGEVKKSKYVYYHCTGYKGKCPEPFAREEVLSARFAGVLRRLVLDDEVVGLVAEALRQSHRDVSRFHGEAVARLQAESTKLQNRVEAMSGDKLDGVVTGEFFARKSQEWRAEQEALLRQIGRHQAAGQTYFEEGVRLLELSQQAADLFAARGPKEQRRLLDFVLGASYAAARTNAGRLLARPAVAREVRAGRAAQRRRTRISADRVLRELAAIAFSDIGDLFDSDGRPIPVHQLDPATRGAIAVLNTGRGNDAAGVVSEKFHVRFWDKLRALELLARHLGLDRPPPPLTVVLNALPDPIRAQVVAALAASA